MTVTQGDFDENSKWPDTQVGGGAIQQANVVVIFHGNLEEQPFETSLT